MSLAKKLLLLSSISLFLFACGGGASQETTEGNESKSIEVTDDVNENKNNDKMPEKSKEKQNVSIWVNSGKPEEVAAFDELFENFNSSQNEINLEVTRFPDGSYNEQVNGAILSGDLPDVMLIDGPNAYNYAWSGALISISDYITDEIKGDLLPSIIDQGMYNGKMYVVGTFDSGLALWGNKSYLEKAEVRIPTSIADAWTLDEFNEALEKLKELEEVEYPLDLKMNYGAGEWFTYGFSPIIQGFGGDLINRESFDSSEGKINGVEAVEAMNWFQELFNKEYALKSPAGDDDFYGKKTAALSWVGHWMKTPHIENLGEDLVLIPMPKFNDKVVTGMGSWAFGITSKSKNPELSWKVIEYLLEPENIEAFTTANGAIPSRKSVLAKLPEYQKGGLLYVFREQLESGSAIARPQTAAYPVITSTFSDSIQNIMNGADVKKELNKASKIIDQDIADNGGYILQ